MKKYEIHKPVFGIWTEKYSDGRTVQLDGISGLKVVATVDAKSPAHALVVAKRLGHTMPILQEKS